MAFQRRASPERHRGDAMRIAQAEQLCGFFRGFDEGDGIRHDRGLGVLAVAVLLSQRGIGRDAFAKKRAGSGNDGIDRT
jgi:hypothetical protein